jgi:thymidylate kinase
MHPTISFLGNFLDELKRKRVKIVPLRYKPLSEEFAFEGDYDFVSSFESVNEILKTLFLLASSANVNFTINRLRFGKLAITIYSGIDDKTILLEIWNFLDVKYDSALPLILWEDIEPVLIFDEEKGYCFPLEIESLYYLSHLKSKKKELSVPLIQKRLHHYKDALVAQNSDISILYDELLSAKIDRDEAGSRANILLHEHKILFGKDDTKRSGEVQKLRMRTSLHRIYAQILKKNKIFPVVGPDGVGKTSIIEALKSKVASKIKYYRFKGLFRHTLLYKIIRPFLFKKKDKMEKNQYDDINGVWMFYIALLHFPFLLLARAISAKIYFSDRYFHDWILQDTRFLDKRASLRTNWKTLLHRAPNSYWFIHLDAPNEVILSRKDELNNDAIDTYRNDIFIMYLEKPSLLYSYINTSLPLEICTDNLLHLSKLVGLKEKRS